MAFNILLVEDSETQLKFLYEGLLQNGFEVETATNELMTRYNLSEKQCKAILDMKLSKLAKLEKEEMM